MWKACVLAASLGLAVLLLAAAPASVVDRASIRRDNPEAAIVARYGSLPVVTRTTEELLRLVPDSLREAALALQETFVPVDAAIVGIVDQVSTTP